MFLSCNSWSWKGKKQSILLPPQSALATVNTWGKAPRRGINFIQGSADCTNIISTTDSEANSVRASLCWTARVWDVWASTVKMWLLKPERRHRPLKLSIRYLMAQAPNTHGGNLKVLTSQLYFLMNLLPRRSLRGKIKSLESDSFNMRVFHQPKQTPKPCLKTFYNSVAKP